jgi:23S rRNA G2445 N2-methylase RlmL
LHKRGYRIASGEAPIKENLAASLVLFSNWRFQESLYDPFCGSGTILIEALMIAKNKAP